MDDRIAQLEEALRFYAAVATYNATDGHARPVDRDLGRRARAALGFEGPWDAFFEERFGQEASPEPTFTAQQRNIDAEAAHG